MGSMGELWGNNWATLRTWRRSNIHKCFSAVFKNGLLNCLANAADFSVLADETSDMVDHDVLIIFVMSVNITKLS